MKQLQRNIPALVIVTLMTLVCIGAVHSANAEEENTVRISAGETLEIASDATSPEAQFSWILTKDRKFLSGQRTRFFQTRLTEPGTYTLDVSVQNPKTGENALHTFTVLVTDAGETAMTNGTDMTSLPLRVGVLTEPVPISNIVYLPPLGGLVKIDARKSEGSIVKYSIDLDTTLDTNNDGNPTNDEDNMDTLSEKSGSPVYFYALPTRQARSIRVSVSDLSGGPDSSVDIPLSFSATPSLPTSSVGPLQGGNGPIMIQSDGLTVHVAARTDDPVLQGKQMLLEWDFGDRAKSLLSTPEHTYIAAGTYVISLTIRDIANGEVLESVSTTAQVSEPPETHSSSEPSASSSSSSSSTGAKSSFSFKGVIQVLFIIFVLLGLAIGLYAALMWIKKRTTNSIQKTLEKMEETIVQKEPAKDAGDAPAPMKLKKQTEAEIKTSATEVTDREKSREEMNARTRPVETPVSTAGPVPPWLKNPSSTPSSAAKESAAPVAPKAPITPATPPAAPTTGPVPDWLKPKSDTPKPAENRPTPAPPPPQPPRPTTATPASEKTGTQTAAANSQGSANQKAPVVEAAKPLPAEKAEPKKPDAPVQTQAAVTPKPAPAPQTAPKAPAPKPAPEPKPPAPVQPPASATVTGPKTSAEVQGNNEKQVPIIPSKPTVTQTAKPQTPSPEQPKNLSKNPNDEPPIAIIQADSLTK